MIVTLKVPSIPDGAVLNNEFSYKLKKLIQAGNTSKIIFDFENVPVISSLAMGVIILAIKECPIEFEFKNVSNILHEELKMIFGDETNKYYPYDVGEDTNIEVY